MVKTLIWMLIYYLVFPFILYTQDIEKGIIDKYANVFYPVKFVEQEAPLDMVRGRGTPFGMVREQRETTKYALGLAVKENLVIVSSVYFSPSRKKPVFVYILADEKTEYKAKFAGENTQTKIVYYQIVDETKKLKFLEVEKFKETKLDMGDSVYILDRFIPLEKLNFPTRIKSRKIEMIFDKPYQEYVIEVIRYALGFIDIQPLALVFNSKGDFFGIISFTENSPQEEATRDTILSNFLVIKPVGFLQKITTQVPSLHKEGWIGFFTNSLEFITKEEAEEFLKLKEGQKGLRISSLYEETPVYKGGLKNGDIILKIGDIDCVIKEASDLQEIFKKIAELEIGKEVKIKYLRKSEKGEYNENEVSIIPIEKPLSFEDAEEYEEKKIGIRVKELTVDYKYRKKLLPNQEGLVVTFVKGGEPAAGAGVISDHILISLNLPGEKEYKLNTIADLKNVINVFSESKPQEIIAKILDIKEIKLITLRNIKWDNIKNEK